eukprot:Pgem_evm1s17214
MIEFTKNITNNFIFGEENFRVGISRFWSDFEKNLDLTSSKQVYEDAIDRLAFPFNVGGTKIGGAMEFTRDNLFSNRRNDNANTNKIIVIFSDGETEQSDKAKLASISNVLAQEGYTIFAVAIGEVNTFDLTELENLTKDPKKVLDVSAFNQLHNYFVHLTEEICTVGCDYSDWAEGECAYDSEECTEGISSVTGTRKSTRNLIKGNYYNNCTDLERSSPCQIACKCVEDNTCTPSKIVSEGDNGDNKKVIWPYIVGGVVGGAALIAAAVGAAYYFHNKEPDMTSPENPSDAQMNHNDQSPIYEGDTNVVDNQVYS